MEGGAEVVDETVLNVMSLSCEPRLSNKSHVAGYRDHFFHAFGFRRRDFLPEHGYAVVTASLEDRVPMPIVIGQRQQHVKNRRC
jgi:hypothetical protein